ncbi:MAG: polysaccharide ABC transporter ATP-binding protein [Limisphaerales bacterium]
MSEAIITVENLGKKYRIRHQQQGGVRYVTLRDVIAEKAKGLFRQRGAKSKEQGVAPGSQLPASEDFWALRDVNFEIRQGDVIGIIGRNGAGKSTLLKILTRITDPTEGRVRIKGRVASLLEVGTGFHGELTGRENIFLNGAILGMHRAEIKQKFDEIVAFSEVEQFLDTPVKRYSSGMYVRLAFAVAAHLEPEILIVDEVLAVGDAAFQKKCLGKMKNVAGEGRTVLFVSHNTEAVRSLCQKCIWLKEGRLHEKGTPDKIIEAYSNSLSNKPSFTSSNPAYGLVIQNVTLKNDRRQETGEFHPGEDLIVEISYSARRRVEKPYVTLGVIGAYGACFTANMLLDGATPNSLLKNPPKV